MRMSLLGGEGGGGQGGAGGDGGGSGGGAGGAGGAGAAGGGQGAAGGAAGGAGGGGGAAANWRDSLPEELRGHSALQSFSDVTNLAKSFISTKEMVGKKGLIPPGANASPEEWDRFYSDLGRPPVDKYEVKLAEGQNVDPKVLQGFRERAHKAGLLPKQAQEVMDWLGETSSSIAKAHAEAMAARKAEAVEGLKKKWGTGFASEVAAARLFATEIGGEGFMKYLEKSGLADDPTFIEQLNLGARKFLKEDQIKGDGSGHFGMTVKDMQDELGKHMNTGMDSAYWNANHPGHLAAKRRVAELQKALAASRAS